MHSFYRVSALGLYAAAALQTPASRPGQCSIPLLNVLANRNPDPRIAIGPPKQPMQMPQVRLPAPPCENWPPPDKTKKLK